MLQEVDSACALVQTTKALFKDNRIEDALAHFKSSEGKLKERAAVRANLFEQMYDQVFSKSDKPLSKEQFKKKYTQSVMFQSKLMNESLAV